MEQARVAVCHAFGFTYKRQVSHLLAVRHLHDPGGELHRLLRGGREGQGASTSSSAAPSTATTRAARSSATRTASSSSSSSASTRKLLGCHCIGERASELVHIGQAAMLLGGTIDAFIEMVFNYPTLVGDVQVRGVRRARGHRESVRGTIDRVRLCPPRRRSPARARARPRRNRPSHLPPGHSRTGVRRSMRSSSGSSRRARSASVHASPRPDGSQSHFDGTVARGSRSAHALRAPGSVRRQGRRRALHVRRGPHARRAPGASRSTWTRRPGLREGVAVAFVRMGHHARRCAPRLGQDARLHRRLGARAPRDRRCGALRGRTRARRAHRAVDLGPLRRPPAHGRRDALARRPHRDCR